LAGFVSLVILMLPHLNPVTRTATATTEPPGNVIVEVRWPDAIDADVDLWVLAPGDRPVGYSNKGGTYFNLLRDDLGRQADPTEMNYEIAYSRGLPAGEYTINLHYYRDTRGIGSVPVTVVASTKRSVSEPSRPILTSRIELFAQGEERTVVRFRLDEAGNLVRDSISTLQRPLRGRKAV
jgi:hypothetical protein